MKIAVKYPTRSRAYKALDNLRGYISRQKTDIEYIVSIDSDDMAYTPAMIQAYEYEPGIIIDRGISGSKIHAYNRNADLVDWDILVVASDDMECVYDGWDQRIIEDMEKYYPDTDGVLWYNDGFTGNRLNTLPIIGKKYYDRFLYVYNPEYISLWCDNEFMEVAKKLKKQTYSEDILFKHNHPMNVKIKSDQLYKLNESYYDRDEKVFRQRELLNFGL